MKILLPGAALVLLALTTRAQAVRYSTQGHLAITSQPGLGHELPAYLGLGDSVQLVSSPPTANPNHISANMQRQFVYVRYPAYRAQPAGQGWVLRHYLVGTADSTLLPMAAQPAQTWRITKVVTTKRYVPAMAGRPAAGSKTGRKPATTH
jgi:hypothetical protein